MRTHFPQTVIASAAWQSRRRSKHRSPVEIAIRQRRTTLLAMTKWVRVRSTTRVAMTKEKSHFGWIRENRACAG